MSARLTIRDLHADESEALGRLMVAVYAGLDGFPKPTEQPQYYEMLARIADFAQRPATRVLVATSEEGRLVGGVVCFGDMAQYGIGRHRHLDQGRHRHPAARGRSRHARVGRGQGLDARLHRAGP